MGRRPNSDSEVVPVTVSMRLAQLDQPEAESVLVEGLPKEWESADKLGGFAPSPVWTTPGDAIAGEFIGMRFDVGPHNSRLYELMAYVHKDKAAEPVSIWGSTALDRCFDSAYPKIKQGDKLLIIYKGEKDTKRGAQKVKLFQVMVKRPGQSGVETMQTGADNGKQKAPVDITPPKEVEGKGKQAAHAGKA